jgi:hypothetical protein
MSDFNASHLVNKSSDKAMAIPSKKDKEFTLNNDDKHVYGSFQDAWHINKQDQFSNEPMYDINESDTQSDDDQNNQDDFDNNLPIISFMNSGLLFEQKSFLDSNMPPLNESGFPPLDNQSIIEKNSRQNEKGLHHDTPAFKSPSEFAFDRFVMHDGENFHELNIDGKIPIEQASIGLSADEQKIIDDFVVHQKGTNFFRNSGPLSAQKVQNYPLTGSHYSDISVYAEQTKTTLYMGGSLSLTPLPIMQLDQNLMEGRDFGEINLNDVQEVPILAEPVKVGEDSSAQNQMNFGQPQQAKSTIQEQVRIIQTTFSEHYGVCEFIVQVKEQFQKFQNGQDKKITVHMRDGRKNLTMVMKMNNENGLDLTFRTSDTAWADILEKNKNYIEEELNKLNDGRQQIGIYYTGELL